MTEYATRPPGSPTWDGPDGEQLAAEDAAMAAMDAAHRRARDVAEKAYWIRIQEEARAQVLAEKAAHTDFADQYLTRDQLDELRPPAPLINRVIPRHSYGVLRGRDASLKSFTAIDWALCLATGKPWQGHDVERVPVLYVAGEGVHGMAKRIRAWEFGYNRGRRVDDDYFTVRQSAPNMHQPGPAFDDLLDRVRAGGYGLVIIDTLRRVSGAADGNSSEMGLVVDNLDRIKRATTDGSVLVVAHTGKDDRDVRGYSGIEDDADFVWSARRRDGEMELELKLAKMKDGHDGRTINLTAVPVLDSLTLAESTGFVAAETLTDSQQILLDTLRDAFPDGAHSGQLMRTASLPESTYHRALTACRKAGLITNIGNSHRPLYALTAPGPDSQTLPEPEQAPDLQNSHDSHELQPLLPRTPTTPTTLRSGSDGREAGDSTLPEAT